jgi:hypothetical protein
MRDGLYTMPTIGGRSVKKIEGQAKQPIVSGFPEDPCSLMLKSPCRDEEIFLESPQKYNEDLIRKRIYATMKKIRKDEENRAPETAEDRRLGNCKQGKGKLMTSPSVAGILRAKENQAIEHSPTVKTLGYAKLSPGRHDENEPSTTQTRVVHTSIRNLLSGAGSTVTFLGQRSGNQLSPAGLVYLSPDKQVLNKGKAIPRSIASKLSRSCSGMHLKTCVPKEQYASPRVK